MKKIFSILAAALLFAACSESDTLLVGETSERVNIRFHEAVSVSESPLTRSWQTPNSYYALVLEAVGEAADGTRRYQRCAEGLFINPEDIYVKVITGQSYRLSCMVISDNEDAVACENGLVGMPFASRCYSAADTKVEVLNEFVYGSACTIYARNTNQITTTTEGPRAFARVLRYQGEVEFIGGESINIDMTRYNCGITCYLFAPSEGSLRVVNESATLPLDCSVSSDQDSHIVRSIYSLIPGLLPMLVDLRVEWTHADGSKEVFRKEFRAENDRVYEVRVCMEGDDTTTDTTRSKGERVSVNMQNSGYMLERIIITKD